MLRGSRIAHGRPGLPMRPSLHIVGRHAPASGCVAAVREEDTTKARAESLISDIERTLGGAGVLSERIDAADAELSSLRDDIDKCYAAYFTLDDLKLEDGSTRSFNRVTEADMQQLGKTEPKIAEALMQELRLRNPPAWVRFQSEIQNLKLRRKRLESLRGELLSASSEAASAYQLGATESPDENIAAAARQRMKQAGRTGDVSVVMITGFESFNQRLYEQAALKVQQQFPALHLQVFSDRDISARPKDLEAALISADVFFASLLFDYDQVEWLKERIASIPLRLVFESALELMSSTQVGDFTMAGAAKGGGKGGPPAVVKKVLGLFGSQKEEDRLAGYLSLLKVGPQILRFFPVKKAQDLRAWLTVYGYWNEGGQDNIVSMLLYICNRFVADTGIKPPEPLLTLATGCLHPDHEGFFQNPADYMAWYARHGPLRDSGAPVAALLLYRKHVITKQPYVPQLVRELEASGVVPVPIFINGVEAHTIVRDQLMTSGDKAHVPGAARVDAIISTIGFPLVGGPAGTMEGGRQADIAKEILSAKNVPYFVAAPLLVQDLRSWVQNGIAGLQSVVLYSLPELDGAIDTVPLGGLVGDNIYLITERVKRLASRIRNWVTLRRKATKERKVAMLLYGFPPGVGATGTAALLNVPASLEHVLKRLRAEGYDLGDVPEDLSGIGDAIVAALKRLERPGTVNRGIAGAENTGVGAAARFGVQAAAAEVSPNLLRQQLTFDDRWGPTEWGPIPFLPRSTLLVDSVEKNWGSLYSYRGISTTADGKLFIGGVELGNVWIGVQPLLGIEGDPMRLLFDRDLTPHPQYAAFYKWLEKGFQADAVVHFGMHGTVEWLPGQPLGNSGFSWTDVLLSSLPNVYIYAANNPSESIIAKRRGYGLIVSHNVPPYGRAGLYKQLAELQALLTEYREDPCINATLQPAIVDCMQKAGLDKDCPYEPSPGTAFTELTAETADQVEQAEFEAFASQLYMYLQEVGNRLFSEGLHRFGQPPGKKDLRKYLDAYMDGKLPAEDLSAIAAAPATDLDRLRLELEQRFAAPVANKVHGDIDNGFSSGSARVAAIADAVHVRRLLEANTEELDSVVKALDGQYILPEAGGDLLRDGPGVLPTGRNIHALDPYRMPSAAAETRGADASEAILESHRAANEGAWPETVAVNLWGLDAIKTKGESVAMVLHLVGARPMKEGTGRIARFELVPLQELGRPRIDCLCNMSGIFRDSFQNVVELLDDLFRRAADADEPADMNFVRKHAQEMGVNGVEAPAARLFSNPAGDYGSMVNERVGASNWTDSNELGATWVSRNAYSYGRGERGTARPDVLEALLTTTDRVVQQVDSVEYGLTDIQEYYANTGALKAAAQAARPGRKLGCSIVEAFSNGKPKELEDVLRLEYRSKLLNPKWAEAMASQGSGGAFEISQRMTAMLGWGATVKFTEDWTWNQAYETYVEDQEMAAKLRRSNPEAFRNVVSRMLEAAGRGMWAASPDMLNQLQELYSDMDEELENVK